MPRHENQYTVAGRLAQLEARCTALEAEDQNLRKHLWAALETKANDLKNVIQSSIRVPVDGTPGRDGKPGVDGQSIKGERGPAGDVLIPNETELQQAVIALRRKLLEQRAAFLAVINQRIAENKDSNKVGQHFAKLLEYIKRDIESLN